MIFLLQHPGGPVIAFVGCLVEKREGDPEDWIFVDSRHNPLAGFTSEDLRDDVWVLVAPD